MISMGKLLATLLLATIISEVICDELIHKDPLASMSMTEMLDALNYEHEIHNITTEDGYILKVYRLQKCESAKHPIILMHGLGSNSIDYILNGPGNALGLLLADECYDVWIPNSRGTFESREHTKYNPDTDQEYWQFSWHEMGQYDIPAIISYVLKKTDKKQVHYVGHSQGTTQFFAYASKHPKDSKKYVKSMTALAPVSFMTHSKNVILHSASANIKEIAVFVKTTNWNEFAPRTEIAARALPELCNENFPSLVNPCAGVFFMLGGVSPDQLNSTIVSRITFNDPAGVPTRSLLHYGQLMTLGYNNKFTEYDYDMHEVGGNMKRYGKPIPPDYPLSEIKVPINMIYCQNDLLTDPIDVLRLSEILPKNRIHKVADENCNHFDLLFANEVKTLVNDVVMDYLRND